jgi:hypothetical protein
MIYDVTRREVVTHIPASPVFPYTDTVASSPWFFLSQDREKPPSSAHEIIEELRTRAKSVLTTLVTTSPF